MALNPVERRMAQLADHWLAFKEQPDARLLIWQVPDNALRLVECFVEAQKLDVPYATGDLFILLKMPYLHGLQYARDLKVALRGQFDASVNDLRNEGLDTDWVFDPATTADTPTGFAQALASLGSRYHRSLRHLVVALMPATVASEEALAGWVQAFLKTGLPERLRVLMIDPVEAPRLARLSGGNVPAVSVQQPAIDGLSTAQDTFAQEGGSNPAAVFRNLFVGAMVLAEKGSADQVKAKAADALAFARKQRWSDQEVALRILVAGALLKEKRHAEAQTVYQAARAAAEDTVNAGHPAGLKLLLQCWFGQAGVHLAAGEERAAAACYDEATAVAGRDNNAILAVEAARMGGFCLARVQDRQGALQRLARAVDIGSRLKPEARALTTLPIALVDTLRVLDAPAVAAMQAVKYRLQQDLEAVRLRSEERGAALAAARTPGALQVVEAERQQQAERASDVCRQALTAELRKTDAAFQQVAARGSELLGYDWLLENDTALSPVATQAAEAIA